MAESPTERNTIATVEHSYALISPATKATTEFSAGLIDDLRPEVWGHSENDGDAADLRDYVFGCASGIETNLQSIAYHHAAHKGMRNAHDADMVRYMKAHRVPYPKPRERRYDERAVEIRVHFDGIVQAIGSTLDCLSAVIVGLSGMAIQVRKADLTSVVRPALDIGGPFPDSLERVLRKAPNEELAQIQESAAGGLAGALRSAGPDGWLDWTLGMRNMVVHRERRNQFVMFDGSPPRPRSVSPRNPHASNMSATRAAQSDFESFFISEDNLGIADGIVGSLRDSIVGSIEVLARTWNRRKALGDLGTVPVAIQWKDAQTDPGFTGYAPGSVTFPKGSSLHMNPVDAERMRRAGLLR